MTAGEAMVMPFSLQRQTALPCLAAVATTASILARVPRDKALPLTPAELARARSFKSASARDDLLASHVLARVVASALSGVAADRLTLVQRCDACGGAHGRPFFAGHPGLHVSLSHSGGVVAAAASEHSVGIDVEAWCHAHRFEELWRSGIFSAAEIAWLASRSRARAHQHDGADGISRFESAALRLWVRKECLVKLGRLDIDRLDSCDLSSLPMTETASTSSVDHDGLSITDWCDTARAVSGAVVSRHRAEVVFVADLAPAR
ncbi:MAG: hypothetical protein JWP52_3199 [Rhizobacter sp.]|nr:hypothetical protein [Rhizobacter sp.]